MEEGGFEEECEGEGTGEEDSGDVCVGEMMDGSATATRQGRRRVMRFISRMPRDQMSDRAVE